MLFKIYKESKQLLLSTALNLPEVFLWVCLKKLFCLKIILKYIYNFYKFKKSTNNQAVVVQVFNPSTWKEAAGGSLWVRGQPAL